MKLRIITSNAILTKGIQESITGVDFEFVADETGLQLVDLEILVVDRAVVSTEALQAAIPGMKCSRILYIVEQTAKSVQKQKMPGVSIVVNDGRAVGVVDEIKRTIRSLTVYKNVLTFWSPISGAGTTTTALTVLKNVPESYRSLYLSLTDSPGIEFINGGAESSISDIFARLLSGVLEVQELVGACKIVGNKYYLGGFNSYVDVAAYSVDNIKALITMASGYFDYILVDAGFGATLMAIAAMSISAHVYVVTTMSALAVTKYNQQYLQVYGQVPEIRQERCRLIVNMVDKDMLLTSRTGKSYGLQQIALLRQEENSIGIRAGYEESLIYDLDSSSDYRNEMDGLNMVIYSDIGVIQAEAKRKERRGLFNFFRGK